MFFGFQLTCGLMLVFYGYSVMKNPQVWGDQGRQAVKAENFPEYCRLNGLFFLKAGFIMALIGALDALVTLSGLLYVLLYLVGLAFAFYPLTRWCKENEGFSWPWPRVESEKKRIKTLRRQQEAEKAEREETLIQAKIERERKCPQGSLAGKGKGRPGKGPEALIALDTLYLSK